MAIVIELKRSSVPGKVPTTTELALGELAINTYDGKLYLKKNTNGSETVVDITSGGGGGGSGSFATSASFAATASFLLGSIANAISASYALSSSFATRASTANSATTAGSATTAESAGTAGFATSATSASYATTASFLLGSIANAISASYALTSSFSTTASFLLGNITSASYAGTSSRSTLIKVPGAGQYPIIFAGSSGEGTGSQELYVTGSDFSYEPQLRTLNIKNLNGTASFATTASFALNAGGSSTINTGSFATTGSNNFNGNQTITGSLIISSSAATELTVVGNSIFSGSLDINSNPSGTYGPFIINSIPNLSNNSVISLINSYQGNNYSTTGSSIDFWRFQTYEFPEPSGIFKSAFVQDLNGLNFGAVGQFKWNIFGLDSGVTGSTALSNNPIGTNLLTLNSTNLSSSVAVVAPSFTGNLTGTASFATTATLANTATTATTATVATTITTVNNTGDAIRYLVWAATGAGNRTPNITTTKFVVNSSTGSMGINKSTITSGYSLDVSGSVLISGSLVVTSSVSASTLGQFTGNNNGFVEFSVRNSNNGVSASSDIAVYNNSGSATLNHINMGINSSGIATGYSFGRGNDAYVYNTGGDLFIGNNTAFYQSNIQSQSLHLFANSAGTPDLTITGSRVGIQKSGSLNATLDISGSVIITGSVQGNVSTLTISTNTASIDLNNGNFFTLTLSGSTHFTATNIKPGQTVNILLTTNATNNSASFNSTIFRQPSGSAYTPTPINGAKDILTLVSYDTTNLYVASVKYLI